jgi:hypothetical protein
MGRKESSGEIIKTTACPSETFWKLICRRSERVLSSIERGQFSIHSSLVGEG